MKLSLLTVSLLTVVVICQEEENIRLESSHEEDMYQSPLLSSEHPNLQAWTKSANLFNEVGLLKIDYTLSGDVWWGTQHYSGVQPTKANFNYERIALIFSSLVQGSLIIEVLGKYKLTITPILEPIQWRPFEF